MADPIIPKVVISMPAQLFTLANSFSAAKNGRIYIGKVDSDPSIASNQIQVYIQGTGTSVTPVVQPISINAGGYPVSAGQIAKFVTTEAHSLAVYDEQGVRQFYFPNVLKYDPDQLNAVLQSDAGAGQVGVRTQYQRLSGVINVDKKTNLQLAHNEIARMVEISRQNCNFLEEFMTPGRSHADAFDAAIANILAENNNGRAKVLMLPKRRLVLDRNVIIPSTQPGGTVIFVGAGSSEEGTVITADPNGVFDPERGLIDFYFDGFANARAPSFVNLQVDGNLGNEKYARCHGIRVVGGGKMFWSNVEVQRFDGAGVLLDSCQDSDFHSVSLHENGRSKGEWNDFNNMSDPSQTAFAQLHLTGSKQIGNHMRFWGGMWERQRVYQGVHIQRHCECKFYSQHHEHHGAFTSVPNYPTTGAWKWGTVFRIVGAEACIDSLGIFDATTNGVQNMITSPDDYGLLAEVSNVRRGRDISSNAPNTELRVINSQLTDINLHNSLSVSFTNSSCNSFRASKQKDMVTNGLMCKGDFTILEQPALNATFKRHVHRDLYVGGNATVTGPAISNVDLIDIIVAGNLNYNANESMLTRPKVLGTTTITSNNTGVYVPGVLKRHELFGPSVPATGVNPVGSICWNSVRNGVASPAGWICSEAGAPGKWLPFGAQS